jgi:hypothetical protein
MHEIGGLHKVGEGKRRRGIALWAARADARGVRAEPRAVKPRERSFLRTKFVLLFILFSSRDTCVIELLFSPMQSLDHPNGREQFDKILLGLLRRILDTNKRVQEAACSAFATLEEVICIPWNAFCFQEVA